MYVENTWKTGVESNWYEYDKYLQCIRLILLNEVYKEYKKIAADGLGFVLFLEQAKVLTPSEREIIIDRAMALNQNIITIDEIRWVVMMALWNNGKENDYLFVEDALYAKDSLVIH